MRPVLFLDFDGVVTENSSVKKVKERLWPACVARLDRLVQATDAIVIVSSDWRNKFAPDQLETFLSWGGYTGRVDGATPCLGPRADVARGLEIHQWLLEHDIRSPFCILDDSSDMVHLGHRLVLTKTAVGLTDADADRALVLLGGARR